MAIETADFISELVEANPTQPDFVLSGDDHLRLIKKVIKQSFPNITASIYISHTKFNSIHDNMKYSNGILDFNSNNIMGLGAVNQGNAVQPLSVNDTAYIIDGGAVRSDLTIDNNKSVTFLTNVVKSGIKLDTDNTLVLGDSGVKTRLKGSTITIPEDVFFGSTSLTDKLFPIGTIYTNGSKTTNPSSASMLGFGTWILFGEGETIVGLESTNSNFDTLGETGGTKTHTLQDNEIPTHSHQYNMVGSTGSSQVGVGLMFHTFFPSTIETESAGGDQPHTNLQPYVVVYRWIRTA